MPKAFGFLDEELRLSLAEFFKRGVNSFASSVKLKWLVVFAEKREVNRGEVFLKSAPTRMARAHGYFLPRLADTRQRPPQAVPCC